MNKQLLMTERLILRHWQLSDATHLFELLNDGALLQATGLTRCQNVSAAQQLISELRKQPYDYAIIMKNQERLIGGISLSLEKNKDRLFDKDEGEVGYWLGKESRKKGYMLEALMKSLTKENWQKQ